PDGSPGEQQSYGYDIINNRAVDPASLDEPTSLPSVSAPTPTIYYLLIDGVAGDSTAQGFEGWFELDSFGLGQSQSGTTHMGGIGGIGSVNVQDLSVALSGNTGLTSFLNSASTGTHLDALQIVGVTRNNENGRTDTVYELTLNNIITTSVSENTSSDYGSSLNVAFNFSQIGLVTNGVNENGRPDDHQRYSWDIALNTFLDPRDLDVPNLGNEPPVISSDGGGSMAEINVAENQTLVTTVNATDPDSGTLLDYAITGGADASVFNIDKTSGVLTFVAAPDFETPTDDVGNNIYQVIVQTSDGALVDNQTLSVNVTNVAGTSITGAENRDVISSTRTVAGQPLPTSEEDNIAGNGGNDVIGGGAGADTLSGGE
ncbi:MAG: type VI secretion system tube protein Hcp, partial [Alphaproteobacteria bacterium]